MIAGETNPAWAERYESLRRFAVEDRQTLGADPLGLSVLVGCGMVGWMRRWSSLGWESSTPAPQPQEPPAALTPKWQHQLTILLAQITAGHLSTNPNHESDQR